MSSDCSALVPARRGRGLSPPGWAAGRSVPEPPCPFLLQTCSRWCPGQAFPRSSAACRGHTCHLACGDRFPPHLPRVVLI